MGCFVLDGEGKRMKRYVPVGGAAMGVDQGHYSNRPIYEGNTSAYIMAGDRPLIRLGRQRCLMGTLRLYAGDTALDEMEHVTFLYAPGRAEWTVEDERLKGKARITVTTPGDGLGLALKAEAEERLTFRFGGVHHKGPDEGFEVNEQWNLSPVAADGSLLTTAFDPGWTEGNETGRENGGWYIRNDQVDGALGCAVRSCVFADGPAEAENGIIAGEVREYLLIRMDGGEGDARELFAAGIERGKRIAGELEVHTPDPYIDACCAFAAAEMDGAWHAPKTQHGNMSWNMPLVGWLIHGHHLLGHHERSRATLGAYLAAQVKEDTKRGYDRTEEGCLPGKDSRFYGQGYIAEDQDFYNMQTQFFHQMIGAWRYSGDRETGRLLKEALALHLKREDECFDPEGTGLYESVLNTWPTDSVYTGGGGALEETCYVYAAAMAMAELTEGEERQRCRDKAEKIKRAFFEKLWIREKGYPGAYVEWGGHRRLHEDAWLYSSFLPVECGLLDEFETAQALYYPQWALQKDENGLYWFSNWTPGIWSVRECSPGENMQMAIACLKGGRIDEGLHVLAGLARRSMEGVVPGDLTNPTAEAAVQMARCVVEGLFGYAPDYPQGHVTVAPRMPMEWENASLRTGDVWIEYRRDSLRVHLARPARMTLRMRLYAQELMETRGARAWRLTPSLGGMTVEMEVDEGTEAFVELVTRGKRDFEKPLRVDRLPEGEVYDPQDAAHCEYGHHAAFQKTEGGWWRELHLDRGEDPERRRTVDRQRTPVPEGAELVPLDIRGSLENDIRDIFRRRYISPRPRHGAGAQIGYDGFSLWTFPFWGMTPPEIRLDRTGIVVSPSGVPVRVEAGKKNAAFVSLWDNDPDKVTVKVGRRARMAILAVAGSTNPMHCGIENARVTFVYGDGEREVLPLVNPQNYIQLCPYPERAYARSPERCDVFNPTDECLLADFTPEVLTIGEKTRALLIRWPLRNGAELKSIELEAMSPDVVVGLMGVTLAV